MALPGSSPSRAQDLPNRYGRGCYEKVSLKLQPLLTGDARLSDDFTDKTDTDLFAVDGNGHDLSCFEIGHTRVASAWEGTFETQLSQLPDDLAAF